MIISKVLIGIFGLTIGVLGVAVNPTAAQAPSGNMNLVASVSGSAGILASE